MLGQILKPEITDLIAKRRWNALKEVLADWTAADITDIFEFMPVTEQAILFRILPKETARETFEFLEVEEQIDLMKAMANEEVSDILNDMSPDDRTALLEELPASVTKRLLNLLSSEERAVAKSLLGYPEYSIGRLMTPDYLAINKEWTVKEVLDYIRKNGEDSETINIVYIIDEKGKLVDDLKIRELLLAPLYTVVSELADGNFIYLEAHDDQEEAVEMFKKYDRIALPVTDSAGILIGIVTVDDVLDVAEEEATEDIQKIGGTEALEVPYSSIPLFSMVRKRAGWLSILFIGETLTAGAMAFFEVEISKAIVLTLFIPLIISSGGNSGSQAATLVIRSLSLGEISIRDWWFVMKREIVSGFFLGALLAILGFTKIMITNFTSGAYGDDWILLAITVAITLIGIVMWGTLTGSMLPLILKKVGFDPAVSSAPFVATLVDVTGLIIYFSVAILVLTGTLL